MPKITFKYQSGKIITAQEKNNLSILEIAHKNGIELEGACEGSLACSTCHIIIEPYWFPKLDVPTWDEEDMLDLVSNLTPTSRLGCQILLTSKLDGLVVNIPSFQHDVRDNKK